MYQNQLKTILESAIILIECGETKCLFEALRKASGPGWNGGFGLPKDSVKLNHPDGKPNSHPAYAMVRRAINEFNESSGIPGQLLLRFSRENSLENKLAVLNIARGKCNE